MLKIISCPPQSIESNSDILVFAEKLWPASYRLFYHISSDALKEKDLSDFQVHYAIDEFGKGLAAFAYHLDPDFGRHGILIGETNASQYIYSQIDLPLARLVVTFDPLGVIKIPKGKVCQYQQLMRVTRKTFKPIESCCAKILTLDEVELIPEKYRYRDWLTCAYIESGKARSHIFAGHFIKHKGAFLRWAFTPNEYRNNGYAKSATSKMCEYLLKEFPEILLYTNLEGPAPHFLTELGFQCEAIHYYISDGL